MDAPAHAVVMPVAPAGRPAGAPLINLQAGYVQRGADPLPRQGPTRPWRLNQNYPQDVLTLRHGPIDDGGMRFAPRVPGAVAAGRLR